MNKFQISFYIISVFFFMACMTVLLAIFSPEARAKMFAMYGYAFLLPVVVQGFLFYTMKDWKVCALAEEPTMSE